MADVIACYWVLADVIANLLIDIQPQFNLCVADVIATMADGIAMSIVF